MTKIFGFSDDIVYISDEDNIGTEEVSCFGKDVVIHFSDGASIRVGYSKSSMAVWWIEIEHYGTESYALMSCNDESASVYSDVFTTRASVDKFFVVDQKYKR